MTTKNRKNRHSWRPLRFDLCQVELEARALRLRTTEDHLAAEKKAAEETEALVMQRHQAALQALETKHQLGSLDFVNSFYFS